jgi:predicted nucleic acid-binding protein
VRLVLDSGAYLFATTKRNAQARTVLRRIGQATCHVPHLFDAEVGNVLRRQVCAGLLPAVQAERLIALAASVVEYRYDHSGPMMAIAWQLRDSLTFYDALYVALAATLSVPMVTTDARLSRAPTLPCRVEVVG